jgi:AIPR protein
MNKQSSFTARKQMIEDRITNIADSLGIEKDKAFLRYVYAQLFNSGYDDPVIEEDIVDGGDDKQFDIIHIQEEQDQATIHLIQVKNSPKFSGTAVVRMRDGLDWIFRKSAKKYKQIANKDLVVKIGEIRDLVGGAFGHQKMNIKVYYVAKNDIQKQSVDFRKEVEETIEEYQPGFGSFSFSVLGINELVDREYELEEVSRKISADLPIRYDRNVGSLIEFRAGDIRAAVCTVQGASLAKLVETHGKILFEENVRTFLGIKREINAEIFDTSTDPAQSAYFWFYNNGITMICDRFDVLHSADTPSIRIEGMQIVNGCQTSMALAHALSPKRSLRLNQRKSLQSDVYLLLKVFETRNPNFVHKITLTTNKQNAVSNRDLASNDVRQRDLAKLFEQRGYFYERKPREFNKHKLSRTDKKRIVPNDKVGQAYLAVVQHKPATAMAQQARIWTEFYDQIYSSRVEELLAAYLIYDYCQKQHKQARKTGVDGIEGAVIKYGHFHVARLIGSYELGENWSSCQETILLDFIQEIANNPNKLDSYHNKALKEVEGIIQCLTKDDLSRVINAFKSSSIQEELDKAVKN